MNAVRNKCHGHMQTIEQRDALMVIKMYIPVPVPVSLFTEHNTLENVVSFELGV